MCCFDADEYVPPRRRPYGQPAVDHWHNAVNGSVPDGNSPDSRADELGCVCVDVREPQSGGPGWNVTFYDKRDEYRVRCGDRSFALGSHAGWHDVHFLYRAQWLDRDHARVGRHGDGFGDDCEPGRECLSELFACGSGQFQARAIEASITILSLSHRCEHRLEYRK